MAAGGPRSPSARKANAPPAAVRIPPQSEEAERSLLGCLLLDPARAIDLCLHHRLSADSFYQPRHQVLFDVLVKMHERMETIDLVTAISRLKDLNLLEQVGGEAALIELIDQTPTAQHARHYIEIVRNKSVLREVLDRAAQIGDLCYEGGPHADEVLGQAEQMILEIGNRRVTSLRDWPGLIKTSMKDFEELVDNPTQITGLSTGYHQLDKILLGMQKSEMIVLAARPSMGKTSLAMNIVENVALGRNADTGYSVPKAAPRPVAVFSLEMSCESLVRRMLCSRARVSWNDMVEGFTKNRQSAWDSITNAASLLMKAPIYVDDTASLEITELRARARRMKKMHGIELVVVDYLQIVHCRDDAQEGRQRQTAIISGNLKAMAKELQVPVLVLSQLNRMPDTRDKSGVPRLSDLRDSGSIEQDADVVLLLRRPIKNKSDPKYNENDPKLAMVDVAKQRNGRTGEIPMLFEDDFTRFKDHAGVGVDDGSGIEPSSGGMDE